MGGAAEERVVLQLVELGLDGRDDLLAAVAGVHVPQPALAVDVGLAVDVVDDRALALLDDERLLLGGWHPGWRRDGTCIRRSRP